MCEGICPLPTLALLAASHLCQVGSPRCEGEADNSLAGCPQHSKTFQALVDRSRNTVPAPKLCLSPVTSPGYYPQIREVLALGE